MDATKREVLLHGCVIDAFWAGVKWRPVKKQSERGKIRRTVLLLRRAKGCVRKSGIQLTDVPR